MTTVRNRVPRSTNHSTSTVAHTKPISAEIGRLGDKKDAGPSGLHGTAGIIPNMTPCL